MFRCTIYIEIPSCIKTYTHNNLDLEEKKGNFRKSKL